jgi:GTP-binding protein HflX
LSPARRRPKTAKFDDRHQADPQAHPSDQSARPSSGKTGRAVVLHPQIKSARRGEREPEARLAEAVGLAEAIDLEVVRQEVVPIARPRPSSLFGKGTVESLAHVVRVWEVAVAVVDAALTPIQQRNLERAWDCKVIDRTGLILEIFGARARTKEGKLQVELAALSYQRSRLVRSWTHLERQRGGFGFLGGPGESQLEIDRRLIGERIARIKVDLEQVKRTRALHRRARRRVPYPVVALVGYTNAGKSTLFNRLTRADVVAEDQLFATLDPTMRRLALDDGREIILSDTVGFISDLPTDLVAAFRATLEEVTEADLVLHVRDIAHPDSEAQRRDVEEVLRNLGFEDSQGAPRLEVLNKIDLLDPEARAALDKQLERREGAVAVSAVTGEGLAELTRAIARRLAQPMDAVRLTVPLSHGADLAWLYANGQVLSREDDEACAHLLVQLDPADLARFEHRRRAS